MNYANTHVTIMQLPTNTIEHINHVRLWKKLFLVFELIGTNGNKMTNCYDKDDEQSCIK